MQQNSDYFQLLKLAQSPAGQQLLRMVQKSGGENLQTAISKAAAGDFSQLQALLSALMADPKARELIRELEADQ